MQSLTFLSSGKIIRLDAATPEGTPNDTKRYPAVLVLHGSGGNTSFWLDRIAPFIGQVGIAIFAVHYFDATGTERATTQHFTDDIHIPAWFQTIRDAIAHIRTLPQVDPARLTLLGISLGAFLALGLGTETPSAGSPPLRALIDISGGLLPPWDAAATPAFPPTLILHGDADTTVSVDHAQRLDVLLTRLGVAHTTSILPGEGHWFSGAAQKRMFFEITSFLGRHL